MFSCCFAPVTKEDEETENKNDDHVLEDDEVSELKESIRRSSEETSASVNRKLSDITEDDGRVPGSEITPTSMFSPKKVPSRWSSLSLDSMISDRKQKMNAFQAVSHEIVKRHNQGRGKLLDLGIMIRKTSLALLIVAIVKIVALVNNTSSSVSLTLLLLQAGGCAAYMVLSYILSLAAASIKTGATSLLFSSSGDIAGHGIGELIVTFKVALPFITLICLGQAAETFYSSPHIQEATSSLWTRLQLSAKL